jgi:hypothetical protein
MTKHQELRDAIRNLMKENDERAISVLCDGDIGHAYAKGAAIEIAQQNEKLQAILEATA